MEIPCEKKGCKGKFNPPEILGRTCLITNLGVNNSSIIFVFSFNIFRYFNNLTTTISDKCVLSEWGEWSECEAGMKTRHREMVSGSRCPSPELADSIPCS